MTLPSPPVFDPYIERQRGTLNAVLLARGTEILGFRENGTTIYLRFRAAPAVPWVRVHVQSTAAGQGGLAAYDPVNFYSSTEVDCRAARVQDVTITPLTVGERYVVFLVPVQEDGAGLAVLFDGQSGRPDDLSFIGEQRATLPAAHVLATTAALGPEHTVSGLTARQVLIATGATTALFRALTAADVAGASDAERTFASSGLYTFPGPLTVAGLLTIQAGLDIAEVAVPGTPSINSLRLYATEDDNFTVLETVTDLGVVDRVMQDNFRIARNTTAGTLTKGTVVRFSGSTGNKPNIAAAQSNSESTMPAVGILTADVAATAYGKVMIIGRLTGIKTDYAGWTEGAALYVDPSTPGGLTHTQPTHPNLSQWIATIETVHATQGILLVKTQAMLGTENGTNRNTFTIGDGTDGNKLLTFAGLTSRSLTMATATGLLTVPAALTVPGLLTAQAGLTVSGGSIAASSIDAAISRITLSGSASVASLFFGGMTASFPALRREGATAELGVVIGNNAAYAILHTGGLTVHSGSISASGIAATVGALTAAGITLTASSIVRSVNNDLIEIVGGNASGVGANIELYGGAHASVPNQAFYDAAAHNFRSQGSSVWATLQASGFDIVTSIPVSMGPLTATNASGAAAALQYDASNRLDITISAAGLVTYDAVGASAKHLFSDDVDVASGKVYRVNTTQVVGAQRTGWTDQTAAASRADLGAAPLVTALASFCRALYDDLKAHGLIAN